MANGLPDYLQDTAKDYAKQATAAYSVPIDTSKFTGQQFVAGEDQRRRGEYPAVVARSHRYETVGAQRIATNSLRWQMAMLHPVERHLACAGLNHPDLAVNPPVVPVAEVRTRTYKGLHETTIEFQSIAAGHKDDIADTGIVGPVGIGRALVHKARREHQIGPRRAAVLDTRIGIEMFPRRRAAVDRHQR